MKQTMLNNKKGNYIVPIIIGIVFLITIFIVSTSSFFYEINNSYKIVGLKKVWLEDISSQDTIKETDCVVDLTLEGSEKSIVLNQCSDLRSSTDLIIRVSDGSGLISSNFCEMGINNLKGNVDVYTLKHKKNDEICYVFFKQS